MQTVNYFHHGSYVLEELVCFFFVCLLPGLCRDNWMDFKGFFNLRKEVWDVLSDNFRKPKKNKFPPSLFLTHAATYKHEIQHVAAVRISQLISQQPYVEVA